MDPYQLNTETWNKLADAYENKFMNLTIYNNSYDYFYSLIEKKEVKILEVGCGPGNITKYLLSKNPYLEMTATDVSSNMIARAKANNPSANCIVLDARNILQLNTKYGGILSGFCIPYLQKKDVRLLLENFSNLLVPNGILYLSFVEGKYTESTIQIGSSGDKMFFHFYEKEDLETILNLEKIEIVYREEIPYTFHNQIQNHIVFIAKKTG